MNLSGGPRTARSYAPAQVESVLISPLPVGLIFFLLQVHLHDAPCPVSVQDKGKVETVLN
jgi:hypothetical protein